MSKEISFSISLHDTTSFFFAVALVVAFIDFLAGLLGRTVTGMSWWEGIAFLIIFYTLTEVTEPEEKRRR